VQRRVDALEGPAGLTAVHGPAVTITLSDAPPEVAESSQRDPNRLVVHQQDIQAVVNALWAGGAEAMTIQDQRGISTTGIKCVGNTVFLHGVTYSPPYRIAAIGDPTALRAALDASDYISYYLEVVQAHGLGYEVIPSVRLELPGFEGSTTLKYAEPGTGSSSGS